MFRVAFLLSCLVFASTPALADRADADACAMKLGGLSLATYKASIDKAAAGATLRQAIGGYLKPLYDAGKINESQGYKSGYAAAMCVRLVHRKTRRHRNIESAEAKRASTSAPAPAAAPARPRNDSILGGDDDDD